MLKVMVVQICDGFPFSISNVSVYYGPQLDILVKSYARSNISEDSLLNFEHLDILWV